MTDVALLVAIVCVFAALVTVHLAIVVSLGARRPRRRAAIALFVIPLAPYWAWAAGLRARAVAWLLLVGAYALLAGVASR